GLSAMLPGKPTTSHRLLDFEQHQLDFYLTTATAGGQSYTVGHLDSPWLNVCAEWHTAKRRTR
ncbi:hypothetical protein NDQ41_16525, partial [Alcaligenes faecalis]|nr:hypothetical protein [Alcaligenes faecalis]